MGYTHYWTQKRDFTKTQWTEITADIKAILAHAQHVEGIVLAGAGGEGKTSPQFDADAIMFNGLGDDSHETFVVHRKRPPLEEWQTPDRRGWDFCKTARKPYDRAVVACLCYLATVTRKEDPTTHEPIIGSEAFSVSSDGDTADFLAGLDMARVALPQYGNVLDLPLTLMENDRWCAPWIYLRSNKPKHEVHFCIDGHGYVLKGKQSYRFETHEALARWLESTKAARMHGWKAADTGWGTYPSHEPDIWNASGSFDNVRTSALRRRKRSRSQRCFRCPLPTRISRRHSFAPARCRRTADASSATASPSCSTACR
ncbi:hypothetical protein HU675_0038565 [Bradyrhizobium septentrionale]|uniref:hypothetical protein n=1 Tax=Bradyrhizobium septentrionale TaxID=1404411 RepID=UPI00159715DE|nr:hypothetical protein [Bradyrhizobium septentrionale]UGY23790.1 hypothetical protein HU675_0038565 [Bradyrhizobium septentrionale]